MPVKECVADMASIELVLDKADEDPNVEKPGDGDPIGVLDNGAPFKLGDTLTGDLVLHLQCGEWQVYFDHPHSGY